MTSARPAQRVELISIDKINILNPRHRNPQVFKEIVSNIKKIGLKRPITVSMRNQEINPVYDLVCGQGRLEACQILGHKTVPALVIAADKEDCLIASLVENCARRNHGTIDLLQDIIGMTKRGFTEGQVALKTGLTIDYVRGVTRLMEKGEHRLLKSVESGVIPISVATDIAEAQDKDIQAALAKAYENGTLKGKKLLAAKRLVEMRRQRGKGKAYANAVPERKMTADALVKAYQEDTERKKDMIQRAEITSNHMIFITEALRKLAADEKYLNLVEREDLDLIPESIALSLKESEESLK